MGHSHNLRFSNNLNTSIENKNIVFVEGITLIDQSTYTGYMKKAPNGYEVVKHGKGV